MFEESKDVVVPVPPPLPNMLRITSTEEREQQKIMEMILNRQKVPKCSVCAQPLHDSDEQFML